MYSKSVFIFFLIVVLLASFVLKRDVFAANINATITAGIFVPGAPVNLAATIGDKSMELSWSPPISNGGAMVTDYVVEYKLTVGGVWFTFPDGVSTNSTTTVTGLSNDNSYTFRISAVNSIGQGSSSAEISATPGSPAQVIIQSFSDLTVSDIATTIRITNEGSSAYEYQYTWCVTDSDLNLCGGGNDVFGSSAAKLIQSGENFDTTLNSTVLTAGSYWFHLSVNFGSDSSQSSQLFTATTPVTSGSVSSGGGGGGGGIFVQTVNESNNSELNTGSSNADFNKDDVVNSVDFSILLAFWKTKPPFKNASVDINKDGFVNSIDFSILLYHWGKKLSLSNIWQ